MNRNVATADRARPIDSRPIPGVGGIDLVQALNYLSAPALGVDFCYQHYTSSHLPYRVGSRPRLERIARDVADGTVDKLEVVNRLGRWVASHVVWAGHYRKQHGHRLASDRGLSEEALIELGAGWCNEQARVLCLLTQAIGLPSRIVFASDPTGCFGHCTTEVLLPQGWLMYDPSLGFAFVRDGQPVRAVDVWGDAACRAFFTPLYQGLCRELIADLGHDILKEDFVMATKPNPLEGFALIGFHNHFLI